MAMQPIPTHSTQASNTKQTKQMNKVLIFCFDDALFPTTKLKQILERKKNAYKYKSEELNSLIELQMTAQELFEWYNLSYITYQLLSQCIEEYTKQNICIVSVLGPNWIKDALQYVKNIGHYSDIHHLLFGPEEGETMNDMILIYQPSENEYKLMQYSKNFADHAAFWTHDIFKHIFKQKVKINGDEITNIFEIISNISWEYKAAEKLKECVDSIFGGDEKVNILINKLGVEPTIDRLAKRHQALIQVAEVLKMSKNGTKIPDNILDSICGFIVNGKTVL